MYSIGPIDPKFRKHVLIGIGVLKDAGYWVKYYKPRFKVDHKQFIIYCGK